MLSRVYMSHPKGRVLIYSISWSAVNMVCWYVFDQTFLHLERVLSVCGVIWLFWVFYQLGNVICRNVGHIPPYLHCSAPHWSENVEHLAADGYYCKALLCSRRCVKGSLYGRYVLEWSVNAGASRAALWSTWVTLRGVILALAGEPGTACMRNVSKLAECLCSLAVDPENALSYFSNIICKNFKTELKKKRSRTSSLSKPPCARVLWHEPSKQCVSDCGGRHATEYALTDPRALTHALALRSFRNIKDIDVTFITNAVHQTRRVWCC